MHAVFTTSAYSTVIPWIIAVDSLAHSLRNQVTYHVQKYNSHFKTRIIAVCIPNTIHSANMFNDSSLTLYPSTCYDKLIIL